MSYISFKVKPPMKVTLKKIQRLARQARRLEIPHKRISIWLDRWVQLNFRGEGNKVGGPKWKRLKAGGRWTGKGGTRKFNQNVKILQDTGRLRISFRPFFTRRTAGIGSAIKYAPPHEKGLGFMPMRKMLPRNNDRNVIKSVNRIFESWLAVEQRRARL